MNSKTTEFIVGLFLLTGILAFVLLIFIVAGFNVAERGNHYILYAKFNNIGGLKVRSPVKVGGVVIGRVQSIALDPTDNIPKVTLSIQEQYDFFSEESNLAIQTSGILGEQYLSLSPGFLLEDTKLLTDGDWIEDTSSALILENLIGQFIYSTPSER